MINNAKTIAENKLKAHFENGVHSNLSIEDVAHLMDIITFGVTTPTTKMNSIFFSFSQN
jgi:hypothetical protein